MSPESDSRTGIIKSEYDDIALPTGDICSLLFPRWRNWWHLDALECVRSGRKMTYGELHDSALRLAQALKTRLALSVGPSGSPPRITVYTQNVIEFAPIAIGILAAGCTLSTANPDYTSEELVYLLKKVEPSLLIIHPSLEEIADAAIVNLGRPLTVYSIGVSVNGKLNIQDILCDSSHAKCEIQTTPPSAPAFILFSGATTGPPKGIVLNHSAVAINLVCITHPYFFPYGREGSPQVTVPALSPLYHSYGLHLVLMTNLYLGSKILIFKEYCAKEYGAIIEKHKVEFLLVVPTILNHIIKSGDVTRKNLASVKGLIIAASAVFPALAEAFREMTSQQITFQEGFGMTEMLGTHLTPAGESFRIGVCGKLVPHTQAKVVHLKTRQPVGPHTVGELLLKGPSMMAGYLNDSKLTSETIDKDGWLHTGDMVTYTEDGYFSVVDRMKDMIWVDSELVSPAAVEDALMRHDGVDDVAVIGLPTSSAGNLIRAYVVRKDASLTEEALVTHVEDSLPRSSWLTGGVRFVPHLPKSKAGKLLRRVVRDMDHGEKPR